MCQCSAVYAKKKAELAGERKRREGEREAAKEARRQAMRDYMEHNFLEVSCQMQLLQPLYHFEESLTWLLAFLFVLLPSHEQLSQSCKGSRGPHSQHVQPRSDQA